MQVLSPKGCVMWGDVQRLYGIYFDAGGWRSWHQFSLKLLGDALGT